MARENFINAEILVQKLSAAFEQHEKSIQASADALSRLDAGYKNLPSDYIKAQKEINSLLQSQAKTEQGLVRVSQQNEALKQKQIQTQIKINQQKKSDITLRQAERREIEANERALKKETAKLEQANSIYNKVQQKLNSLQKEYRDLATQKEITGRLTDQEAKRYDFLSSKITKYDTILKGVDASMGKYQRNVGNYASAFNPLQNSINQLTREMPAFANSVQTGFMAISNNLPIFFDSMQQIIAQNKELRAQGQETTSVISQLGRSFLSWGTALSVGVTLLTFFGDEIVDAIAGTKAKEAADLKAKEATEEKNNAEKRYLDTIRTSAAEEITRSKLLLENARNVNLSMKERKEAIDELRTRYPKYLKNLSDQNILAGNTADAENALNDALVKRGIALALQDKIQEAYSRLTDEIIKQQKAEQQQLNVADEIRKSQQERLKQLSDNASATEEVSKQTENLVKLGEVLATGETNRAKSAQGAINQEIQDLLDLYNQYSSYLDIVQETGGAQQKANEQRYLGEQNSRSAFEHTISVLEEKLSLMNKENAAYGILETQLEIVREAYNALYGEQEKNNDAIEKQIKFGTEEYFTDRINKLRAEQAAVADNTEMYLLYGRMIQAVQLDLDKLMGKTEDLNKETNKFLQGFINEFASSTGFTMLFDVLGNKVEDFGKDFQTTFVAVAEIAQETFNFLNQNSAAAFDREREILQKRYELSLRFAEGNQQAQEEIRRQFEERQREIRLRELKAQKNAAIFNAIINTAQAVTAALPNIPLSVIIGALGAAQVAFIASQPVPAFKDGGVSDGGTILVNDASGSNYKEVVRTPDGQVYKPQGRNTLMNVPKGTEIFKNYDEFDKELNSLLGNNDISPFSGSLLNNSIGNISIDTGLSKQDLDDVFRKYVPGAGDSFNITFDEKGYTKSQQRASSRTVSHNNRVSFKGKTFLG